VFVETGKNVEMVVFEKVIFVDDAGS